MASREWLTPTGRALFGSWSRTVGTLASLAAAILALPALLRWAVLDAAFGTTPESCQGVEGACWSIIGDLWQLFLVGLYPPQARWRVGLAGILLLLAAILACAGLALRRRLLLLAWPAGLAIGLLLVRGAPWLGLPLIDTQVWGGLMLTVILATVGQTIALPLGIALALARRAQTMPAIRLLATAYIEILRSLPFMLVLLLSALVLPLVLPPSWPVDRVVSAQVGVTLFAAVMIAEVVRGGLDGVPTAQAEAAEALGLTWLQRTRLVVLPQALRLVRPALVGTVIAFVKGSTLVVAIGLYDLLGSAVLASANPRWLGVTVEPLLFVAAIFWAICFTLSRLSEISAPRGRPTL